MSKIKVGILRERKIPIDRRVPLSPNQCLQIINSFPNIDLVVEKSPIRCFSDELYRNSGIEVVDSVNDCDVLFGVKEVPKQNLIANKTYFYFSHTIKKQIYNRDLLAKMIDLNIKMVDYETLCDEKNKRLIGFGTYAGIVGCYNGFLAYGLKTKKYDLKAANDCFDRIELEQELKKIKLSNIKIILTGGGRVGGGALEILQLLNIKQVDKDQFLNQNFNQAVFVNLDTMDYNVRKDGASSTKADFYLNPNDYKSIFKDFARVSELFIAGHFYGNGSPFLFTREDAKSNDFKIRTIADISCDIDGPVASTIRPSSIENPLYGYDVQNECEVEFDSPNAITVMAIDNLPCELPKDASIHFGNKLIQHIFPVLLGDDKENVIERATICADGQLMPNFQYLDDFVKGN